MTTSMQQQTIYKKPPWWRRRSALARGLALCVIILCTALAVGIVVVISNSGSYDASVSKSDAPEKYDAPGMQPSKAEALIWQHLLLKLNKKIENVVTSAVTRRDGIEPESRPLQTPKPKAVVSTTAATRRVGTEPKSTPLHTAKPKADVSTTAATRLNATEIAPEPSNNIDACYTSECLRTASMIVKNMDRNVNPCENFYRYACGGFVNSTKIPNDRTSVDTFTRLEDQLQAELRNIFEANIVSDDPQPFKNVKNFYLSCIRYNSAEARPVETLQHTLKNLGGWPVLDGPPWNESAFDWPNLFRKLYNRGYSANYLFKLEVDVDKKNSTKHIIYLDQPDLGLSRVFLTNQSDRLNNDYYQYMVDIAKLLGDNDSLSKDELERALQFEKKLAEISLPVEKRLNETQLYNPMTLQALIEKHPNISWVDEVCRGLTGIQTDGVVIVKSDGYFAKLGNVISQSSTKDLANYLTWRVVMESTIYLDDQIRNRSLQYETLLTGRTNYQSRWTECVDVVSNSFPLSVGAMYIKHYSDSQRDKVNDATEIVTNIQRSITGILEGLDWVDEKTRQGARKKATALYNIIVNQDEHLKVVIDHESVEGVVPYSNAYLNNALRIMRQANDNMFEKLRKPVKKFNWAYKKATSPQVHYSKNDNSIFVPAAILRSPFFNTDRPGYMNYGAIGFLIARQLTHGFDSNGIHYDENGNLVQPMNSTTEERYRQREQCLAKKYSSYTVKDLGLKLNGYATLSENTADNGGLKAAYIAYNNWISKNGAEKKLPDLDNTPKQLFWISAANSLCSKYRQEELKYKIHTDTYSPAEFRVLGAMSNIVEFAQDFKCSQGSTMNPTTKCSVK